MYAIPTEKDYTEIKRLIDILVDHDFGNWDRGYTYFDWLNDWNDVLANNYGFTFYEGCTKVVAVNEDFHKWVIKINLGTDKGPHNYESYCGEEALNWIAAVNAGLESYFAATYFIEVRNGIEFFIQEYAESNENEYDSRCYNYYQSNVLSLGEENTGYCEDYWDMDDSERLTAIYGDDSETHSLINFCWDTHINDLHCGNFGETNDGRTVIFDYSGY